MLILPHRRLLMDQVERYVPSKASKKICKMRATCVNHIEKKTSKVTPHFSVDKCKILTLGHKMHRVTVMLQHYVMLQGQITFCLFQNFSENLVSATEFCRCSKSRIIKPVGTKRFVAAKCHATLCLTCTQGLFFWDDMSPGLFKL